MGKKLMTIIMAVLMAAVSFAGCSRDRNPGNTEETVDSDRTQLYVGTYDGGNGDEWIYAAKERFEEAYKDVCFEPGTNKKGVQVMVSKSASFSAQLVSNINNTREEVFFALGCNYYEYLKSDLLLDITDIVSGENSDLSDMGDSGTIEDKIPEQYKTYLKTDDNKYYALPFYEATYGIIYDVSLFCDKGYYFDENGELIGEKGTLDAKNGVFKTRSGDTVKLSTGPDGISCTYDDGLPRTYDEFFAMCDLMYKGNVVPITWPGAYTWHMSKMFAGMRANNAGAANNMLNYTFDGVATDIIDYDADGNIQFNADGSVKVKSERITNLNAYRLYDTASTYNAVKFIERIAKNEKYYDVDICTGGGTSQLANQYRFIMGKHMDDLSTIGMIVDGNWWYNESRSTIETANRNYGESEYGLMPMPKPTMNDLGPYVVVETDKPLGFVKSVSAGLDPAKADLAKLFLKFVNTDESIAEFLQVSNFSRAMNYTLTQAQYDNLSLYAKNIYETHKNTQFVVPFGKNDTFINNSTRLLEEIDVATINGSTYNNVVETLIYYRDYSAETYFKGLVNYHSAAYWSNIK